MLASGYCTPCSARSRASSPACSGSAAGSSSCRSWCFFSRRRGFRQAPHHAGRPGDVARAASCSRRCPASAHTIGAGSSIGTLSHGSPWASSSARSPEPGSRPRLSTTSLKVFFAVFLYYVATHDAAQLQTQADPPLPGIGRHVRRGRHSSASMSSLVGIGGGSLSVPFMSWCNVPMHNAIGTSAAIGFPIAVAGTLGYLVNGICEAACRPRRWGYLYLPALCGIAVFSMFTAPLGARLAHRRPVVTFKRMFAVLPHRRGDADPLGGIHMTAPSPSEATAGVLPHGGNHGVPRVFRSRLSSS